MKTIDDHLARVEKYGFDQKNFPLKYNGHFLSILSNDAYIREDGRLLFDFSLYCNKCQMENNISGRFPNDVDDQIELVVNAKVAVFDEFEANECQ